MDLSAILVGVALVAVIAAIALAVGVVFGRVVGAPVIRRLSDRAEQDDEESSDRPA